MIYRVIGLMSGSSLDGLDIVFAEFEAKGNSWNYDIKYAECVAYSDEWVKQLQQAGELNAYDYLFTACSLWEIYSRAGKRFYTKEQLVSPGAVDRFSWSHCFHSPQSGMTSQLGDGAAIAAVTGINVVSDLRAMDVALGGQGAPIVPVGEKLLFPQYAFCLNIGGIANLSFRHNDAYIAFDICPANRVLNMLANELGKAYDDDGVFRSRGQAKYCIAYKLNALPYYRQPFPKSLANNFGVEEVYPIIQSYAIPVEDALRTYSEHITQQMVYAINGLMTSFPAGAVMGGQMLITGGGAFNGFLIAAIKTALKPLNIEVVVPDEKNNPLQRSVDHGTAGCVALEKKIP